MGICGADRISGNYVGDFSVGTDDNGKFLFVNLPPNRDYYLYAYMSSLGDRGAVLARPVHVDGDGTTLDAGDVQVQPRLKLAGRVRLTDGKPVPPGRGSCSHLTRHRTTRKPNPMRRDIFTSPACRREPSICT